MSRPDHLRVLLLLPLVAAGLLSLLASSLTDDNDDPPVPSRVDYALTSLVTPLTLDLGDSEYRTSGIRLAGSYDANVGDALTLERDRVDLDATSEFTLEITISDADNADLEGTADFDVVAVLDFGLDNDPTSGQFSTLLDGTTSLATVQTSPGGVSVAVGADAPQFFSWTRFGELVDDSDVSDDLRFLSAAYATLEEVFRVGLLTEEVITDVEDNRSDLEALNLGETLSVTCDNRTIDDTGEAALFWRVDAPGSGQGSIGEGDGFNERTRNCRDAERDRFVEGEIELSNYIPAAARTPRVLAADARLITLLLSSENITIGTTPSRDSPRLTGELALRYDETELDTAPALAASEP